MARQIAPIAVCICHDRGISVGVSDCHQNRSASNEPLSVGVASAPWRSAASGLSELCLRASQRIRVQETITHLLSLLDGDARRSSSRCFGVAPSPTYIYEPLGICEPLDAAAMAYAWVYSWSRMTR